MKRMRPVLLGAALLLSTAAAVSAHEVTYLGTVMSVAEGSVQVMVIDERTGTESPMTFAVTDETKVFRGDHEVSFVEAGIQVDERCAVTVNTDVPGSTALAIRLADHH